MDTIHTAKSIIFNIKGAITTKMDINCYGSCIMHVISCGIVLLYTLQKAFNKKYIDLLLYFG